MDNDSDIESNCCCTGSRKGKKECCKQDGSNMETSKCGRCCLYAVLTILMLTSSLLFFFGISFARLMGDPGSAGVRAIQALIILVSLLMSFSVVALWVWLCQRRQKRKERRAAEKEAAALEVMQPSPSGGVSSGGPGNNGLDGAGDGRAEIPAWASQWSSDSSVRIWGSRES